MEIQSDNEEEIQDHNIFGGDDEETSGNREDEAQEVPDQRSSQVIKPKRVIKNPQPKLDAIRLMGSRGVGILQSSFKNIKFKGKGHEKEDLNVIMKGLEHWAHRLFPKLPFEDTLKQIEKLGTKKPVQNMMKRIRLDMLQSDEILGSQAPASEESDAQNKPVAEVDVFDELLGTGGSANNAAWSPVSSSPPAVDVATDLASNSQPVKASTLTAEQLQRIQRNRLLALERRKAKQLLNERGTLNNETEDMDSTYGTAPSRSSTTSLSVIRSQSNSEACDDQLNRMKSAALGDGGRETVLEAEEGELHSGGGRGSPKELKAVGDESSATRNGSKGDQNHKDIFTEDDILNFVNSDASS